MSSKSYSPLREALGPSWCEQIAESVGVSKKAVYEALRRGGLSAYWRAPLSHDFGPRIPDEIFRRRAAAPKSRPATVQEAAQ